MKPSKSPPLPSSFFLPQTPSLREYSISFITNPSSADIDYLPITQEKTSKSPNKLPPQPTNSPLKPVHNGASADGSPNKYRELIRNSPLDRFINVDEFIGKELGKFPSVTENEGSSSVKKLGIVKESSNKYLPSSLKTKAKGPSQDSNYKQYASPNPKIMQEPLSAQDGKKTQNNLRVVTSPMLKLQETTPSSRRDREFLNVQTSENINTKPSSSPKMGWENTISTPNRQDVNYLNTKVNEFNSQLNRVPSKPTKIVVNSANKDPIKNTLYVNESNFRALTPNRERENFGNLGFLEIKSAREQQHKLITPENKDKFSLDFLFSSSSKANSKGLQPGNKNQNSAKIPTITVTQNSSERKSPKNANSNSISKISHKNLSVSPNKNPKTHAVSGEELSSGQQNSTCMKSIDTGALESSYGNMKNMTSNKTFTQFESQPQNTSPIPSTTNRTPAKTDELKLMAFQIFKPKSELCKRSENPFAQEPHHKKSEHDQPIEKKPEKIKTPEEETEGTSRKITFGQNQGLLNAGEKSEIVEQTPYFSQKVQRHEELTANPAGGSKAHSRKASAIDLNTPEKPSKTQREPVPNPLSNTEGQDTKAERSSGSPVKALEKPSKSSLTANVKSEKPAEKPSKSSIEKSPKSPDPALIKPVEKPHECLESSKPEEKKKTKASLKEAKEQSVPSFEETRKPSTENQIIKEDPHKVEDPKAAKEKLMPSIIITPEEEKQGQDFNSITSIIKKRSQKLNKMNTIDVQGLSIQLEMQEDEETEDVPVETMPDLDAGENKKRSLSLKHSKEKSDPSLKTSLKAQPNKSEVDKKVCFTDGKATGFTQSCILSTAVPAQNQPALEDLDGLEPVKRPREASKTTKNEVAEKGGEKQLFVKLPEVRAKSAQRNSRCNNEIKMNFLNINEFVSTLGRGEVLPKRNSAKSANDLHINLELLQRIATEQSANSPSKSHPKQSKTSSMISGISGKTSTMMPEIPENPVKKSGDFSTFAVELSGSESSDDDSDSSCSPASVQQSKEAKEPTFKLQKKKSPKGSPKDSKKKKSDPKKPNNKDSAKLAENPPSDIQEKPKKDAQKPKADSQKPQPHKESLPENSEKPPKKDSKQSQKRDSEQQSRDSQEKLQKKDSKKSQKRDSEQQSRDSQEKPQKKDSKKSQKRDSEQQSRDSQEKPQKKDSKKSQEQQSKDSQIALPKEPEERKSGVSRLTKDSEKSGKDSPAGSVRGLGKDSEISNKDSAKSGKELSIPQKEQKAKLSVTQNKEIDKLSFQGSSDESEDFEEEDPNFVYYMSNMRKYTRTACKSNYFKELYCEHLMQSLKALHAVKNLPEVDEAQLAKKRIKLPRKESLIGRKTLIFDLDETLIHCNESLEMPCDVFLSIKLGTGTVITAGVNVRPYAIELLQELSQYFEIIVFTASHSCYANRVLDHLDPNSEYIHHRLFRDNCVVTTDGAYVKDLRIFEDRDLANLAIIDNACYSFAYQIENGVPIIPFYHNKNDGELKELKEYLMQFMERDVRELNRDTFKLQLYSGSEDYEEVVEKMFPNEEESDSSSQKSN